MDAHKKILAPFFGKRCVIKGAFTYENGLYFYAFDEDEEPESVKLILEYGLDGQGWHVLQGTDVEVAVDDIVMFGATAHADNYEKPSAEVERAIRKHGLRGLLKLGVSTPGPLFYDRSNGLAYFFPDGSPMTLGKDGVKPRTLKALKIRTVG